MNNQKTHFGASLSWAALKNNATVARAIINQFFVSLCCLAGLTLALSGCAGSLVNGYALDSDGDGISDSADVDANGNGLIEISTAAEFNMIRNNLAGSGLSQVSGLVGSSVGCGGAMSVSGARLTSCSGYELTNDLSLAEFSNWEPIGGCTANNVCPQSFSGVFDGNGHTISDVNIELSEMAFGVGLFGAVAPSSQIRHLHLRDVRIVFDPPGDPYDVGMLVGHGRGIMISESSVIGGEIFTTAHDAGGLIGDGEGATITSAYVEVDSIRGPSEIGGLIGGGIEANVLFSCANSGLLSGRVDVGGLLGDGEGATIVSSFAQTDQLRGSEHVGPLAGKDDGMTVKDAKETGRHHLSHCDNMRLSALR